MNKSDEESENSEADDEHQSLPRGQAAFDRVLLVVTGVVRLGGGGTVLTRCSVGQQQQGRRRQQQDKGPHGSLELKSRSIAGKLLKEIV